MEDNAHKRVMKKYFMPYAHVQWKQYWVLVYCIANSLKGAIDIIIQLSKTN